VIAPLGVKVVVGDGLLVSGDEVYSDVGEEEVSGLGDGSVVWVGAMVGSGDLVGVGEADGSADCDGESYGGEVAVGEGDGLGEGTPTPFINAA
jgi:hypothetical protein